MLHTRWQYVSNKAQSCSIYTFTHYTLVCSGKLLFFRTPVLTKKSGNCWSNLNSNPFSFTKQLSWLACLGSRFILQNITAWQWFRVWHQFPIFPPKSACLLSLSINKWHVISVTQISYKFLFTAVKGCKRKEHEGQDLNSVRTLWLRSKTWWIALLSTSYGLHPGWNGTS